MDDTEIISKIWNVYSGQDKDTDIRELYNGISDPNGLYNNKPLLHFSAGNSDPIGTRILLERGADTDAYDESMQNNALHALAYGDGRRDVKEGETKEAASVLIEAGVSTLTKNVDGRTAAYIAAEKGRYELIEALAEAGKKMDLTDSRGNTPLHAACDHAKNAESFFKYTEPRYKETMERKPSYEGEERILEMQKASAQEQYDRDKKKVDDYFRTVKALYDSGMDPDRKNNYDETPKDLAAKCMDARIAAVLNGIYSDGEGTSDLEMRAKGMNLGQALMNDDHDALAAILELGADPNEICVGKLRKIGTDLDGKTPLGAACAFLDVKSIELLLKSGADVNLKDPAGKAPIAYCATASANGKTLSDKIPDTVLDMMLDKGMSINDLIDEKENTFLNLACGQIDSTTSFNGETLGGRFVQLLLKKKADVNISNKEGVTPLMRMCGGSNRCERIQVMLLEKGADVQAKDRKGNTPLIHASMNRDKSVGRNMAEMLFEFGDPLVDAINNDGKNALELATEKNNEELVKLLLERS